jgi:hypothetical protein
LGFENIGQELFDVEHRYPPFCAPDLPVVPPEDCTPAIRVCPVIIGV